MAVTRVLERPRFVVPLQHETHRPSNHLKACGCVGLEIPACNREFGAWRRHLPAEAGGARERAPHTGWTPPRGSHAREDPEQPTGGPRRRAPRPALPRRTSWPARSIDMLSREVCSLVITPVSMLSRSTHSPLA